MSAIRSLATAGFVFLAMGLPVTGEVPGQRAPAYAAALERWLADDEAAALEALARLAGQGNLAAQMLLALIDKTPALQGPWLSRLPRDERIALMRLPGGISGLSWMRRAAEAEPSARLWLRMWQVDAPAALAIEFATVGEPRAAREALVALDARGQRGAAAIAAEPGYPQALRYLVWREWAGDPARAEARAAEIAALAPGDPQGAHVGAPPPPEALSVWLRAAPEAAPVAAFCADLCAESAASCVLAAAEALGSHSTLVTFGSPSERLVPGEAFHHSPRGHAALLRRVLLNVDARGRRGQIARARAADSCFGNLLEVEAQRYMPQRD